MKQSELFWTSLLAIAMIICGIFYFNILIIFSMVGSLFVIAHALNNSFHRKDTHSLWCFLFPISWIIIIITTILLGSVFLFSVFYSLIIEPINKKINGE
jgi:membrane-bound metal-dependent hydrolase YbcI (DUF457 family)